jgi:hypothetical protein
VWGEEVKGSKFTCAEYMQESPVNNHTEQAWRHLDNRQLLIISDFFPEYDYVNKTQQAQ